MNSDLEEVKAKIAAVEAQIQDAELELNNCIEQYKTAPSDFLASQVKHLRTKEQQLRAEKQQLQAKEQTLLELQLKMTPAPISATSSPPIRMQFERKTIEEVVQNFFASELFGNIRSRSEEDLSKSTDMEIAQSQNDSELDTEAKQIEASSLLREDLDEQLKKIGVTLPYYRVPKESFSANQVTVLVGVSGCGKSRTCMDIASRHKCLYFEGVANEFQRLTDSLSQYNVANEVFVNLSKRYLSCIILSRIMILNKLEVDSKNRGMSCRRSVSYQMTNSFLAASSSLSCELFTDADESVERRAADLIRGYIILFDEAQRFIYTFPGRYPDGRNHYTRPMLRFLVNYVSTTFRVPSFWCGTQLRMKDVTLLESGAGGKPLHEPIIFTQFSHYNSEKVRLLIQKWLPDYMYDDLVQNDKAALNAAGYWLQGRPRFVTVFVDIFLKRVARGSSFRAELGRYIVRMTDNNEELISLKWFWMHALEFETRLREYETGEIAETPDHYLFDLLLKYLYASPTVDGSRVAVIKNSVDLVRTALVSLSYEHDNCNYYMTEPLVFEAGLAYLSENSGPYDRFMKYVVRQLVEPPSGGSFPADARGKLLDRVIALRFRFGWWRDIPEEDDARNEIPPAFHDMFSMPAPTRIYFESSVSEAALQRTFCVNDSSTYVLPCENSGLDGAYRCIGYLGKMSLKYRNNKFDQFVESGERVKNMKYTNLDNWFPAITVDRDSKIKFFKEANTKMPFLFICGEFPFYGPTSLSLPKPERLSSGNYVVHVDLSSRLSYFLLGRVLFEGLKNILASRIDEVCKIEQ
jgi:hypothetical protein